MMAQILIRRQKHKYKQLKPSCIAQQTGQRRAAMDNTHTLQWPVRAAAPLAAFLTGAAEGTEDKGRVK